LHAVESAAPRDADLTRAQAIVVLGGDVRVGNGRDIPDRLGPLSLERLAFAAAAHRRLGLPIAVSGGRMEEARESEAALMAAALAADFAVPARWREERSRTTWENAVFTAALLQPEQVTAVVVVTHSWHLPRAVWSFAQAG